MIFEDGQYLSIGESCYLDLAQEIIIKDGLKISLSRLQFRILYYLASKMGQTIYSEELIHFAWGKNSYVTKDQLYVYMNRIRQRMEDNPHKPKCLFSVRGAGYVLHPRRKSDNCSN